jgi:hypothetical protein
MSGQYAGGNGIGSVIAAEIAAEEIGGTVDVAARPQRL